MTNPNLPAIGCGLVHVCSIDGTPFGIGFLLDRQRVATCAHVVTEADPDCQRVLLKFPYLDYSPVMATVQVFRPPVDPDGRRDIAGEDIAILQLDTPAPANSRPVCLFTGRVEEDQQCWVHGIPLQAETGEQWSSAHITPQQANGWRGIFPDHPKKPIVGGYSGSPVMIGTGEGKHLVAGMITTFVGSSGEAFMIPAAALQKVAALSVTVEQWRPLLRGEEACELEHYARWAMERHGALELIGLGGGDLPLGLEDVYVPLRMESREFELGKKRGKAIAGDVALQNIFSLAGEKPVTLIGQPGAGKTTALRKLLHLCLTGGPQLLKLPPETLPIFLRLRRLDETLLEQPMAVFIARELADMGKELPVGLGERLWRRGNLLLLLDGLDEIAQEGMRRRVAEKLRRELFDQPPAGIRVVISSRNAGFAPVADQFKKTLTLEVQPLNREQVAQFVDLWFTAAYAKLDKGPPAQARESGQKLLDGLGRPENASQRIQGLTGSPLLLALLCLVVVQGGDIPRRRVDFYEECLKVLLHRWGEKQKGESPKLELATTLSVLQEVAWQLHHGGRRDNMTADDFVLWTEERLNFLGHPDVDGYDLLQWLHHRTGVIAEYAAGEYGFMHLGFQEYLSARHVAVNRDCLLAELCRSATARLNNDAWWQEVILLLAGMAERTLFADMARLLLHHVEQHDYGKLLRGCLEDAREPDLTPFVERLTPDTPSFILQKVLRILKGDKWQKIADLRKQVETLRQSSSNTDVKDLCNQFLNTAPLVMDKAFHLLLIHAPHDTDRVREWRRRLEDFGLKLWPENRPWRDRKQEVRQSVSCVAVFVGSSPLLWEDADTWAGLKILASRTKTCLVTLEKGSAPLEPSWVPTIQWVSEVDELAQLVRERTAATAPGQVIVEPITGIRLLAVHGGEFIMGCNTSNQKDERPEHPVRLSDYWLAETPVTNRQYGIYLQANDVDEPAYWRDRRFSDPEQPVVGVNWVDAMAFCRWLSEGSGQPFTLPSEAQWEYAARGTDGRDYPWGNEPPTNKHACFGQDWNTGRPAPVGSYPSGRGPYGHLDLAGNVWEWVLDWYDSNYYAESIIDDPQGPSKGAGRVSRGGSWGNGPAGVRSAFRDLWDPARRSGDLGFRLARTNS